MKVIIYSDGGADPNPGVGGWAAILRYGEHEKVLTGNEPHTTNNRMELQAAIAALKALSRPSDVEFYTDSEYVRRGITEWIKSWIANDWDGVANVDLWQELWQETQRHNINWHWVKGHAGDEYNERVDALARQARLAITPQEELPADTPRLFIKVSCKGNPGPGGWGAVLEQEEETEQFSGWEARTTANRLELIGVLEGLRQIEPGRAVQLFTTSDYLFQGATKWIHDWRGRGWQKQDGQPVANSDLWQRLDEQMDVYPIKWVNAKGEQPAEIGRALKEAARLAANAAQAAAEEAGQ